MTAAVAVCLTCAALAQVPATPTIDLTTITSLNCTFATGAQVVWAKDGTISVKVKEGAVLNVTIRKIDAADGTAELVSPNQAEGIVQVYGWNMHILEASRSGRMLITTVFGREGRDKKLKAVHTRTDYLPIDLPGFTSEPEATQYYGECEAGR
jgi:hypothetical protein